MNGWKKHSSSLLLPLISILPLAICACVAILFYFEWRQLSDCEERAKRLAYKTALSTSGQDQNLALLSRLSQADRFYLDKHLESLLFLETEIKQTEALLVEDPHNLSLKKRLDFLKSGNNRLLFTEGKVKQNQLVREMEEKQQTPVEMNEEDLKKMLSLIEEVPIWPYDTKENKPQFLIRRFHLERKQRTADDAVFSVSMELIKREGV